ncbi:BICD family-like cargo adapter 1 [Homalodisca vitripennis]|uniref:BICD family-like cargo adapter 1 n=1 Tax=Homalodisca vitripennis TaxID=197043 RepID=UPI001EEBD7C4|nr:BICD family-like cargo adapter 1 [Homalodisca vitripennis]
MAESVSQDLPQTKPHINNNSELNPLSNSLQELEKSLTECDTQSSEESLIVAAKIGSALLQENNYLKNENRRLQDKLNSLEAKVEELENCEGKYVAHMERLQEKISELEAQLTKEKLYVVEAQTIFEDHDGKQIELIKDYENKIEELESKIMTLQQHTPEKTDRRLRTTGTQTLAPDYQTNNTFPSVLLEIGLLKNSHNAMEEKF